jgi:UDP-glucose 4,6-dehydratase
MFSPTNLLVTGGCGFIGSNFINYYKEKNPHVKIINFDKLDYCSDKNGINHDKLVIGNLKNKDLVVHILNEHDIDTVIHFAAQTHVDNSFGNSLEFTIDNILGTHTLLECCRVYNKIKRFIHISTDEVYGEVDIDHKGCTEKSLLNPTNPYAATKAGAEFIARSYFYSFNMPIIITRGNNVYGPRQYPEKLIPKFINQLINNEKCTIHGKGETRRNFIYVNDVVKAIEIILQKGIINNIYNIGTNNEYSVSEIADKLIKYLKPNDKVEDWIQYVTDRNFNDYRYAIKSNELYDLGWKEETNFDNGFEYTIQWFQTQSVTKSVSKSKQ